TMEPSTKPAQVQKSWYLLNADLAFHSLMSVLSFDELYPAPSGKPTALPTISWFTTPPADCEKAMVGTQEGWLDDIVELVVSLFGIYQDFGGMYVMSQPWADL
ncbi:MAG: hypothetical protein Q9180_007283, partial [Flavoplaca navasiana]